MYGFVSVKAVDLADPHAKDHELFVLATEIVAVMPRSIDLNAPERQRTGEKHLLPRLLQLTCVLTRTGQQYATRAEVSDVMEQIAEALR